MSLKITTEMIKELRDSTGISVMQCKHALEEAEGDMKKALAILKKTSSDIALKKVNREVKAGAVIIKINDKKSRHKKNRATNPMAGYTAPRARFHQNSWCCC